MPRHIRKVNSLRKIRHLMEALATMFGAVLVARLPWSFRGAFGQVASSLAFRLNGKHKQWAYSNLDIVFADRPLSMQAKDRIVRTLFENIARGLFEFLKIGNLRADNLDRFFEVADLGAIERALEEGNGVLVFSAHLGNWEYFGAAASRLGFNFRCIIKRQHNPYTDQWLKAYRERRGGVKCFYDEPGVIARIGRHLKRNGIIAFLLDQAHISKPIYVPFFGIPCTAADGPAKLHLWFGAPIVLATCIRAGNGKYHLALEGPHRFEATGDSKKDSERIMTWVHGKYAKWIRAYPEQWFSLLTPRWWHKGRAT